MVSFDHLRNLRRSLGCRPKNSRIFTVIGLVQLLVSLEKHVYFWPKAPLPCGYWSCGALVLVCIKRSTVKSQLPKQFSFRGKRNQLHSQNSQLPKQYFFWNDGFQEYIIYKYSRICMFFLFYIIFPPTHPKTKQAVQDNEPANFPLFAASLLPVWALSPATIFWWTDLWPEACGSSFWWPSGSSQHLRPSTSHKNAGCNG